MVSRYIFFCLNSKDQGELWGVRPRWRPLGALVCAFYLPFMFFFKGVSVLSLYERLLIVVFILVVNHTFCLSEAGSAQSHLLAACEEISLVIGRTSFILGMLQ